MDRKFINEVEIWGGIECSLNRVNSKYFDQLQYAGHYERIEDDIKKIYDLGIRTMRYPLIWERISKNPDSFEWEHTDAAMEAITRHGIRPIAGLVHHGSGPAYADVTKDSFATELARFAAAVASRYPWIEYYTPVNEPLTTARFCGLYGLWYPHKRNDRDFVRILLNELKAVVLSMEAIRKINPNAKLVQTEDLAKIYSTPFMKYQADFENHRRWLTFDILCGELKPGHPLWTYFKKFASSEDDLQFFIDNPCHPDIIGLDYYPTSERYLDENLDRYPSDRHGTNRRHRYADVEAIRIPLSEPMGPYVLLKEVWERYRRTMVVTEVHIHCDHDNQIRWFSYVRDACLKLKQEGCDILALTTWAMLGSFGWNKLLTRPGGDYEWGAFDVSSGTLVRTALGDYVHRLILEANYKHAAEVNGGWWTQDARFIFHNDSLSMPRLEPECIQR